MSPPARELVGRLATHRMEEKAEFLRAADDFDYRCKPVSVETFICDREYLGLRGSIFPKILEDLTELFAGRCEEVVLSGGIGWGKSKEAELGMLYDLYRLSCLRDPAAYYGLMPGSTLAFVVTSVRQLQAERVLFAGICDLVHNSPYFRVQFPGRKVHNELTFPNHLKIYPVAANEQSMLGEGVFSAVIDEVNFWSVIERSKRSLPGEGDVYDQAQIVAERLSRRIRSRFNQRGKLPGHIWFISSVRFPHDFTERKQAEAKTNPLIFVRHRALWEAKPRSQYRTETFKVEVGDVTRRTRVLKGEEIDVRGHVIEVPMDFYQSFCDDPDKSVRDLAGISVLSIQPFIVRREAIRAMFEAGRAKGMLPTFSKLEVTLQGPAAESEYLLKQRLHWVERQKTNPRTGELMWKDDMKLVKDTEPVLAPVPYYAHVDLSKSNDATGLLVAHVVGAKNVERFDDKSGKTAYERMPVIRVDLALRIVAPQHGEIDIPKVRGILHQLHQLGMEFGKVTFDTFGSQESVKALKDAGWNSDVYSVDDSFTPWEELKQALYDGRLQCAENPWLEKELAQLERTPKKIDHPIRGSKDVADCLAAVVHHAEEGWAKGEGMRGLFQFGEVDRGTKPWDYEQLPPLPSTRPTLTPEEEDRMRFGDLSN